MNILVIAVGCVVAYIASAAMVFRGIPVLLRLVTLVSTFAHSRSENDT
ncbi:MAG: hypothetical protein ACRDQF_13440 [Thermocrispum sp.]